MEDLRNYISTRLDLIKLEVAHTIGELVSVMILCIVVSFLLLPVLAFLGAAAACGLALVMPAWAACLVMAGVFLLLMIILVACRKVLFVRPIQNKIRHLLGQQAKSRDYELEKVLLEAKIVVEEERLRQAFRPINLIMDAWEWIKTLRKTNVEGNDNANDNANDNENVQPESRTN